MNRDRRKIVAAIFADVAKYSLTAGVVGAIISGKIFLHNADEPQPKRLTGENRANREGNDWEILFSFLISVYSVFSVLKNLCFFCTHFTC